MATHNNIMFILHVRADNQLPCSLYVTLALYFAWPKLKCFCHPWRDANERLCCGQGWIGWGAFAPPGELLPPPPSQTCQQAEWNSCTLLRDTAHIIDMPSSPLVLFHREWKMEGIHAYTPSPWSDGQIRDRKVILSGSTLDNHANPTGVKLLDKSVGSWMITWNFDLHTNTPLG